MATTKPKNVDEYIEAAPEAAREKLSELRAILKRVAPHATETLKWGQPVFESGTILFAYSAHKSHLNFAPTGPSLKPFIKELSGFTVLQGSIQLAYDKPLPENLIRKIAAHRLRDVEEYGAKWKI